jgi:hypothetical protein
MYSLAGIGAEHSVKPCLAIVASGLLSAALYLSDGMGQWRALYLVLASLAVAIASCALRFPARVDRWGSRRLVPAIAVLLSLQLAALFYLRPGYYLRPDADIWLFQCGIAACGAVSASYALKRTLFASGRFPAAVTLFLLLGAWLIRSSPSPMIDVWHLQQQGTELLLHGQNPYSSTYDTIYGSGSGLYSQQTLVDGRIASFTYTPLTLLLDVPGRWLGDVRWSLLAATAGTALFMVLMLRRLGWPPGHPIELGAIAFLFHPRVLFLLEQAWTEPYSALTLAAFGWAASGGGVSRARALAAYLSSKQYAVLLMPALTLRPGFRGRDAAAGLLGAVTLAAPFVFWGPGAFWRGVVAFHLHQPFRHDALTVLAAVAATTGVEWPASVGFVAAALVAGLLLWRARLAPAPSDWATCAAAVCLTFFLFNKQAFLNYYWFVGATLMLGALQISPHREPEGAVSRTRRRRLSMPKVARNSAPRGRHRPVPVSKGGTFR